MDSSAELEQLRAAIFSRFPDWATSRDDGAIAAALSVGRTKVVPTEIGIGIILATLGDNGGPFLDGLVQLGQTNRNVYWAMELIKAGKLDVGMAATRRQVNDLASANPSLAPLMEALLNLAVVPDPVTPQMVAKALEGVPV